MFWLLIIILAYFFLALSSLGDKIFLKGKEDAKTYVFYVGLLSGLVVLLIPFMDFNIPPINILIWSFLEGIVYIAALYTMYYALDRFEVSTIVPILGGFQPIFIFLLSIVFFQITELSLKNILALVILIIGTFLISLNKDGAKVKSKEMLFAVFPAFLFGLDFILTKQVFNSQPFLEGLIYMRVASFIVVLLFLLNNKFRKNIFKKSKNNNNNKGFVFLGTQTAGAIGILLQSYAISLVPVYSLAILNALKGIQYIFLFIATFLISIFHSKVLKENFDKKSITLKITSIFIIAIGIALLAV